MIIVMRQNTSPEQIEKIIEELKARGLNPVPLHGVERTVIAVIGDERVLSTGHLESLGGVEKVMSVLKKTESKKNQK